MDTTAIPPEVAEFPVQFRLSFKPFIAYLQQQKGSTSTSAARSHVFDYLLQQFTPLISEDSIDETYTPQQLEDMAQLLKLSVLPLLSNEKEIPYGFGLPIPLDLFHASDSFNALLHTFEGLEMDEAHNHKEKLRFLYQLILNKCYGVHFIKELTPSLSFQRVVNGVTKFYRLTINVNFVEPQHQGSALPPLQPEWTEFAKGHRTLDRVPSPLLLGEFVLKGFCVFLIEDITEDKTIQQLKEVFVHLQSDSEEMIYRRFEKAMRDLCGQPDIRIGLMPFIKINQQYVFHPDFGSRSVVLAMADFEKTCGEAWVEGSQQTMQERIAERLAQHDYPHVFCNLNKFSEPELQRLVSNGLQSFILYPIKAADQVVGVLEIGSPNADALDDEILFKVERVIPLVRELLLFQISEFNKRIQRLIRQKFTTLQPAVEWKFNEVAWQYLRAGGKKPADREAARIRFPQVYPLYGAIDIRNSSLERHWAIRTDLSQQLDSVASLLQEPSLDSERSQPLQQQTRYWREQLLEDLTPDTEESILLFLSQQITPYFRRLQLDSKTLEPALEYYFQQTDPQTGDFHQASRNYERSLDWINAAVNGYIEQEEQQLQAVYPHYFEKYRTDGMEYNIYVGQSISPQNPFVANDLRRLRLWQLTSMVDLAQLTHRLLPHLPRPLQTTQLILAHSQPVNISFREDEHRFDVEGSYSIRYEVIKKRIDKALVRGTNERLTQPDHIALVYTHQQEIADYLPLITLLQEQNRISPTLEYLDLEPLQGVVGLKAIRLAIQYEDAIVVSENELMVAQS